MILQVNQGRGLRSGCGQHPGRGRPVGATGLQGVVVFAALVLSAAAGADVSGAVAEGAPRPAALAVSTDHGHNPLDASQQAVVRKARNWLEQGRGETAYQLLAPLLPALAGHPEFDLVFGQAALGVDSPSEAAFAFERCLAVQPSHGLCRLGMARAHISLNEESGARRELDILSRSEPPAAVQGVIADYRALLSGLEATSDDTRLTSYIQLGIGYDSNINNATSHDRFAVPALGNMVLDLSRDGRRRESSFAKARFNIRYSTPLAPHWRFLSEANVEATGNQATHHYDTLVSDLSVGLARRAGRHQFVGRLQGQNYRLHDRDYRNLAGVLGQYAFAVTDRAEISVFAQGSRLYYPRQRLRNAHRYTLGSSWTQGLANDRAVLYLTAYGGQETARKRKAPRNYDYGFTGVRAGGMVLISPRLQLEAGAGVEARRFRGSEPLFLKARRDTYYDAYVGLNYALNRKLSIRPQYRYSGSDSNIRLHDYQRHVFTVNLRYELF